MDGIRQKIASIQAEVELLELQKENLKKQRAEGIADSILANKNADIADIDSRICQIDKQLADYMVALPMIIVKLRLAEKDERIANAAKRNKEYKAAQESMFNIIEASDAILTNIATEIERLNTHSEQFTAAQKKVTESYDCMVDCMTAEGVDRLTERLTKEHLIESRLNLKAKVEAAELLATKIGKLNQRNDLRRLSGTFTPLNALRHYSDPRLVEKTEVNEAGLTTTIIRNTPEEHTPPTTTETLRAVVSYS